MTFDELFVRLIELSVRNGYDIERFLILYRNGKLNTTIVKGHLENIKHDCNLVLDENYFEII